MARTGSIIVEKHSGKVPPVCAITTVKNITLIDIVSSRMLGAAGFLAHIFNNFLKWNISIDVIATSEVSVSLTVNTKSDLSGLIADLEQASQVSVRKNKAIVTIICDAAHSSAKESSGASNANAVLLHSVDVEKKDANGTALIFGFVNIDRLDTSVKALITTEAKKALNGKVTFLK